MNNAVLLGGFNGGGNSSDCTWPDYRYSTSGGGGTDFRTESTSLYSRLFVAAGGGGCARWTSANPESSGGNGGIIHGSIGTWSTSDNRPSTNLGTGATQLAGGTNALNSASLIMTDGSFGKGGNGASGSTTQIGGGGGGGYWGGGPGRDYGAPGAGGSSYISGYKGCVAIISASSTSPRKNSSGTTCTESLATSDVSCSYHYSGYIFTDTVMKAGNESMPAPSGGNETGHSGNGYARIMIVE